MDQLLEIGLESLTLGLLSSDRYYKKPIIIFNSASFCGFTNQLISLQKIYQSGQAVPIAVPTNQYGQQEPGDDIEISQFYQSKYGVTFPITKKLETTHPFFEKYGAPTWNFNKYLFDKNHNFVNRYESSVLPEDVIANV